MRNERSVKTKSAPRNRIIGTIAAAVLFIILCLAVFISRAGEQHNGSNVIKLGGQNFYVETVDTPDKRQQGLSGRDSLKSNQSMLFVFDEPGQQCIWMKDMRFNLDIIWLDEQKKVVSIKENVTPATYPENFCANGKYVLEINAGTVDAAEVRIDQKVAF